MLKAEREAEIAKINQAIAELVEQRNKIEYAPKGVLNAAKLNEWVEIHEDEHFYLTVGWTIHLYQTTRTELQFFMGNYKTTPYWQAVWMRIDEDVYSVSHDVYPEPPEGKEYRIETPLIQMKANALAWAKKLEAQLNSLPKK